MKISLCVTKLCGIIEGALSEMHSNVSDCNLKWILRDEKGSMLEDVSFFSKCHTALAQFRKSLPSSPTGRPQEVQ